MRERREEGECCGGGEEVECCIVDESGSVGIAVGVWVWVGGIGGVAVGVFGRRELGGWNVD